MPIQLLPRDMFGLGPITPGLSALGQGVGERFTPNAMEARQVLGDPYHWWDPNTQGFGAGTPGAVQRQYGDPLSDPSNANQFFWPGTGQTPDWFEQYIQQYIQNLPQRGYSQGVPSREQGGPVENRLNPMLQGLLDLIGIERKQGEVPIRAHQGEYIMNKQATQMVGPENLEQLNQEAKQNVPKMQDGGPVTQDLSKLTPSELFALGREASSTQNAELSGQVEAEKNRRMGKGTAIAPPTEAEAREAVTAMGGQPDRPVDDAQVQQNMSDIARKQFFASLIQNDPIVGFIQQLLQGVQSYGQNAGSMPGGGFEQAGMFSAQGQPQQAPAAQPAAPPTAMAEPAQAQGQAPGGEQAVPLPSGQPSQPIGSDISEVGQAPSSPQASPIGFRAYNQPMGVDWASMQNMDPMSAMMMLQQYADTQGQPFQPRFGPGNIAQPAPTAPASQGIMSGLMDQYLGGVGGQQTKATTAGTEASTALTEVQTERLPVESRTDVAYKEALTTAAQAGKLIGSPSFYNLDPAKQADIRDTAIDNLKVIFEDSLRRFEDRKSNSNMKAYTAAKLAYMFAAGQHMDTPYTELISLGIIPSAARQQITEEQVEAIRLDPYNLSAYVSDVQGVSYESFEDIVDRVRGE